jgi:hypothetical protein
LASPESIEDEGEDEVGCVGVFWDDRLDLEDDFRIEGVRSDSLAFGSSSFVYLPIEGL